jgi:hypothetical protein
VQDWIAANETLIHWLLGLSALTFVGGLVLMPILVARMRADYFVTREPSAETFAGRHPLLRWTILILKNVVGGVLVLAGIAMSLPLFPGQGLITILIGFSLLNFRGKRRLELAIVRQPPVLRAIQWMRARANRPPLEMPDGPERPRV